MSAKAGAAPSIGLLVPEALSAPEAVDLAVSLEDAGFDSAWFTEIDREPFVRCSATIARTQRLRVGTGIAQWTRSPVTMAMTAAELHELASGRFTFGLGTGTAYANEGFHDIAFERPARRMADYVDVVRGAWGSGAAGYSVEGGHFTVRGFQQPYFTDPPPLLLAAVGDGMLRLYARRADGVVLNPSMTPWAVRTLVAPQLEAGAAQAGRSLETFQRVVCLRASVDTDRAAARERARHGIAEYGGYPVHRAQYAAYGFAAEADRIAGDMARGDVAAAVAAVSEEMVDVLGIASTPDEVRRRLRAWDGVVHTVALTVPVLGLTADEVRTACDAVVAAFST